MELYDIKDVEIFAVGKWNKDSYSIDDLQNIVKAFDETKQYVKPYLKLGHSDKQKLIQADGLPALGWIEKLKISGTKLIADFAKVPKKIYELIKSGAYRRVSSEIFVGININQKKYPYILKAVALLGGDTPAVWSLNDIMNLYQLTDVHAEAYEEKNEVQILNYTREGYMDALEQVTKEKEELIKKFEENELKLKEALDKNSSSEQKFEEYKLQVENINKELEQVKKDKEAIELEVRNHKLEIIKKDVNGLVDKLITEKKLLPADKEKFFTLVYEMRTAGNEVKKYKIGEEEKSMEGIIMDIISTHTYSINTEGETKNGDVIEDVDNSKLDFKAKKYAEENKVSYKEALLAISK